MTGGAPRADVLARLRAAVGATTVGTFCLACGSPEVRREEAAAGEVFVCTSGHRAQRAFVFDGRAAFSWDEQGLRHETAGAVLRRGDRVLLFLRTRYPLLYTIPAGHVERGCHPADEMRREVGEETGLDVAAATRLWPDEPLVVDDPCRRGADRHRWFLYTAEPDGMPRLSDEGRIVGWYDRGEIAELARRGLLTAPTALFLSRLAVLEPGGLP